MLVTGSPGFIGANLVIRLLREMTGGIVVSLDNMNNYYDLALKEELARAGVFSRDYDFDGHRELVGMQAVDVSITYADSAAQEQDFGFTPKTNICTGLRAFAEWYAQYYGDKEPDRGEQAGL